MEGAAAPATGNCLPDEICKDPCNSTLSRFRARSIVREGAMGTRVIRKRCNTGVDASQVTHQNAGSQYITGCASTGLGDRRDRDMLSLWSMLSPSSLMYPGGGVSAGGSMDPGAG